MPKHLKILLVDDQEDFRKEFALWFTEKGHLVEQASDSDEALTLFHDTPHRFDLAVVDYGLPGYAGDGIQLLKSMRQIRDDLPVIVVAGFGDREVTRRALQAGAYWYLEKPLDLVEVEVLISSVARWNVTAHRLQELKEQAEQLHPFIALSNALFTAKNVRDLVETVKRQAPAFLDADQCTIVLEDVDTGKIREETSDWKNEQVVFKKHLDRPLWKELIHSGGYRIVPNAPEETGIDPNLIKSGIRAFGASACPPIPGAPAVLYAYFQDPLTEEQRLKLELNLIALARVAGMAIERLRQTQLMQALVNVSRELLKAQSEEQVYKIVADAIQRDFEVSTFYISLYDESTQTISFPIAIDKGKKIHIQPRPMTERESGLAGYHIRENKEFASANLKEDKNLPIPPIFVGEESQSYFGVPLALSDRRVIGALSIQRYVPRQFLEPPKDALRTLATQLAVALERLKGAKQLEHTLDGVANRPLMDILGEIAEGVKSTTGADIVVVHPYNARRRAFTRERIWFGLPSEARAEFSDPETRVLQRLLEKGEHFTETSESDEVFASDFVKKYGVVSSGGIVLRASEGKEPVGVLVVNYKRYHQFNDNDQEIIRRFGRRAALALHNFWLREQDQRAELRRQAEFQVTQATRQPQNRSQLIRQVIEAIQGAWQETLITPSLLFVDRAHRRLNFVEEVKDIYRIDIPTEESRTFIEFGKGICGWVAETGQSLLVPDTEKDDRYLKLISTTRSELCVPVKLGGSLLGVLDIEAPEKNFFEDADRTFLEHVADELAIALAAAGQREFAKRVTDAAIEAALTPEKGLEILTQRAHEIAGLTNGEPTSTTIFLLSGNELKLISAYPSEKFEDIRIIIGEIMPLESPPDKRRGIVVRAAIEKKSQMVLNVDNDSDYIEYDPKTQAELAVPVFGVGGAVLGVLNVEYADRQALSDLDKELLEALASQTAVIAVLAQQARQLAEVQQSNAEATALAFMGIGMLDYGHRWKNAAATVSGTVKLLKDHFKKVTRGHARRWLLGWLGVDVEKAREWIERINETISEVHGTDFTTKPDENVEQIPLNNHLKGLMAHWQKREPDVSFIPEFNVASDVCIRANSSWLTNAIDNLVANAVRFTQNRPIRRIVLRSNQMGNMVRVEVEDNGTGIPESVRPYLFLTTVPKNVAGRAGRGIGCLLTHFIARVYKGRAFLVDTSSAGTKVALEIPVAN